MSAKDLPLSRVGFYAGTKAHHMIQLAPLKDNPSGIEVWNFGKQVKDEYIFQVCEYQGTVINVERLLPRWIHSCSVEHPSVIAQTRMDNPEPYVKLITCE